MSGIGFTIQSDDLQAIADSVEQLYGAAAGDGVKLEMGFAIWQVVRAHFAQLAQDSEHHVTASSLGAGRTGFYNKALAGTHQPEVEPDGVSISIEADGIAQRLFGGTIEAKPGGFLTIPAMAIAYGKRAREFDLSLVIFKNTGLGALIGKGGPVDEIECLLLARKIGYAGAGPDRAPARRGNASRRQNQRARLHRQNLEEELSKILDAQDRIVSNRFEITNPGAIEQANKALRRDGRATAPRLLQQIDHKLNG